MPDKATLYLETMLSFVKEAGALSLAVITDSVPGLKPDASVITKADKAISELAKQYLQRFLEDPRHILIDEEDPDVGKYFDQGVLNKASYIWSVDPIDGTRLYANQMPLYGISIGLMKDLKPWLGVVYFPMLNELFYCDGSDAYYVKNTFSDKAQKVLITPNTEEISAKSLFFCNDTFFDKFYWSDKDFHIMIHACAVVNLCWPTIGRGIGCFQRCHLWDFAGSWPIIEKAGFHLYRISDRKVLGQVDVEFFAKEPKVWQMSEYFIISTERNLEAILSKIHRR